MSYHISLLSGFYMLPVCRLVEPPKHLLVRVKKQVFIEALKQEMLDNPLDDVQPILCIVQLKEKEKFESKMKEAYTYYTIGGNHSREALQQILSKKPDLNRNRTYTHRLCSIYSEMESHLLIRLASKHNRATNFSHDMTAWDRVSLLFKCTMLIIIFFFLKVLQCRKLLFEMSHVPYEETDPPERPSGWKKTCSLLLTQKVRLFYIRN